MRISFQQNQDASSYQAIVYLVRKCDIPELSLTDQEILYLNDRLSHKDKFIEINRFPQYLYIQFVDEEKSGGSLFESLRKAAFKLHSRINFHKHKSAILIDLLKGGDTALAFIEGLALSNYQFVKYFKDADEKKHLLDTIAIKSENVSPKQLEELEALVQGVYCARDLVNEPVNFLNAVQLSEEVKDLGAITGFDVEVYDKLKIQSLKMGGVLAVNKGSVDPPTFTLMEWKPEGAINKKPLVLVGKGVVYDTGGLSLKPTKDSMDSMKSDMGGAAAVIGAIYAVAKAGIPVYVIGLIPATDNRPTGNACAPGDIITMHNGLTVEVMNTDAEGRLLLADALSYASKFNPGFVVDIATLTGAASVAIGKYGMVGMANDGGVTYLKCLQSAGERVYERIVEFPFWEEYAELIKSDVADLSNLGGRDGGAITAGKFLEHFVDYPWVHLDIAGPAFLTAKDSYRGKGGSGVGVRLLFEFIKQYKG